jgi:hypothetical protein
MKNFLLISVVIGLLIVLCTSCYKCAQNQTANLSFTPNDLRINPYTGFETLIFKNLYGDSIVFSHGKRETEQYTQYQYDYETAKLDHHGCQGDYFTAQKNWTVFQTNSVENGSNLDINLYFIYTLYNPASGKMINLFFFHGKDNSGFDGDFLFDNDTLYNYNINHDSIVAYHNVLTLGPKQYTNVYELYCHNGDPRNQEWFSIAYYSMKTGFCGFRSNFGAVWYLE